ncbi:hypothetical protein GCM10011591_26850 [Nocardia camponoti]|uniref:Addiction module toxin, HicA family n=1 Tax=Nocardia camponoti TaxID=1616106 RepID=A0A917QK34_9NOCA|nr:hypothetical protein GCM10011591_26850 [Nocardia camponoti]
MRFTCRWIEHESCEIAKVQGGTLELTEGGSHTKAKIGERQTVIPRHSEVNEMTAKAIIKHMKG